MKIILIVTDSKGKNLVFVSDKLEVFSLDEAVRLTKEGKIDGVHVVKRSSSAYLRTNRKVSKQQELESLSISSSRLFSSINNLSSKLFEPLTNYLVYYQDKISSLDKIIRIGGWRMVTKNKAREKLQSHKELIFEAAKHYNIDPYLLGAIIIDEIARLAPFEDAIELLVAQHVGRNTSLGIAQIKINTARDLIETRYYDFKEVDSLANHIAQPKHNVFLAAARIRSIIDRWGKVIDISNRPEIIATLYSLEDSKKPPHSDPQPNERGNQIVGEFYQLSKSFLN
ncbi:MAG: hypothetical protein A2758_02190 [Candidatus Zambryskibacteria bacterium RIFCSPHIGHO2_01_FULL_49_18]|uniref:Uncharacterized protein n=2 Tax=Candidatus Zambryskiibacteriota TaxID=1817925 RepID=A0A1G2T1Z1_9BACT|nr:MAG: hypothetical protein A2758_02190 [Candidatus Zambryskibacteria bacterium RIFCSPHIGHO2_01_FULL_49_18]OHB06135.1 MAG: hypothetical protein A3A26_01150 [Candidatus Zambryskibacteria bacterium RIFCSPLOWO2_01_FULL_47_14]